MCFIGPAEELQFIIRLISSIVLRPCCAGITFHRHWLEVLIVNLKRNLPDGQDATPVENEQYTSAASSASLSAAACQTAAKRKPL